MKKLFILFIVLAFISCNSVNKNKQEEKLLQNQCRLLNLP